MRLHRKISVTRGSHYDVGLSAGQRMATSIASNLMIFWQSVEAANLSRDELISYTFEDESRIPSHLRDEIMGLAEGSGQAYRELLAYNLYRGGLACDC